MKLINNNLSPLPFYDTLALQNHRKDYAFGQFYPLISPIGMILPFQVVIPDKCKSITGVALRYINLKATIDITKNMTENGLAIKYANNHKVIVYPGILPIHNLIYEGQYYLQIAMLDDEGIRHDIYSDIFVAVTGIDKYLMLEYGNSYNFTLKNGVVDFSDDFKFRCYLDTQIGKPEYIFEEEATERMGYSFIESQVSKKVYKFTFVAPEYLCDALRLVRLCDDRRILCKNQEYNLTTFNMDVAWEEQGDLAAVECEFETDTVIANIGGAYTPAPLGDYNKDYNEDFTK